MLKIRLIPVLLLKKGRMVKPVMFSEKGERDVGWPITTAKIYDSQEADELIFLDITATRDGRRFLIGTLKEVTKNCFVPLTAGGGIRNLADIKEILSAGADKVSINTFAIENPGFVKSASNKFGRQCIVISLDVRRKGKGQYEIYTHGGKKPTGLEVKEFVQKISSLGAGEILLTSIDREGSMDGYDLELIRLVSDAVSIPVIAHGGAGDRQDFVDAVKKGHASAVAAASVFHFSDSNLTQVKSFMFNNKLPVRLN